MVGVIIFAAALAISLFLPVSPIFIVIAAIVLGLVYGRFAPKNKGKDGNK